MGKLNQNKLIIFLLTAFSLVNLMISFKPINKANAADTVPRRLNYQGRLMDTSDNLLTGTYYLCFSIWDNATVGAGSKIWPAGTPTPTSITTSNGVFSAEVGSADTLNLSFSTYNYYLQVYVNSSSSCSSGGETLSPRQHLTSAAYTINADMIDGLDAATSGLNAHILATESSGNATISGYLGVGTTNPLNKFVVSDNGAGGLEINPSLDYLSMNGVWLTSYDRNASAYKSIIFDTGGTAAKTMIMKDGYVGIGTATPNAKLTIGNNVATGYLDNYSEYQLILYDGGAATTSYGLGVKGSTIVFNSGAGAYSFDRGGGATAMSIDYNANVGIGSAVSSYKLDVRTSSALSGIHLSSALAGDEGAYINVTGVAEACFSGGGNYANYTSDYVFTAKATAMSGLIAANGGIVLWRRSGTTIGSTYAIERSLVLDTSGHLYLPSISGTTGGSALKYNTSTKEVFYDTSSIRYKENIRKEVDYSFIYDVPVVTYDRTGGIKNEVGIIAEDLEKIAPQFISYNEKGQVETYDKDGLVPILVKAVQEQKKEIKEIKETLSTKVDKIISSNNSEVLKGNSTSIPNDLILTSVTSQIGTFTQIKGFSLNIGNGKLEVDALGNVTTKGDLTASNIFGHKLTANSIEVQEVIAKANTDLELILGDSAGNTDFVIKNSNGKEKIKFTSDGKIKFVESKTEEKSSSSIGEGTITAGKLELFVENSLIDEDSRVFTTAKTPLAQTIAVVDKYTGERIEIDGKIVNSFTGFRVVIKNIEIVNVEFDYWIIN